MAARTDHSISQETAAALVATMNSGKPILDSMARARGLSMSRVNPTEDLLLPVSGKKKDLEDYKTLLDHYAARLLLREAIKSKDLKSWTRGRNQVQRFCDPGVFEEFLTRFRELGVLRENEEGVPIPHKKVHSFGPTYEWYTAMVLATEYDCPSAWGVTFENVGSGGDHDVMASLSGSLLYVEVKTSPPGRIESPEISGFIRRLVDIAPDIAIFNNDTHLRMKDKIVPLMESAVESLHGKRGERLHFKHLTREIYHLRGTVYVTNSKPDLKRNLETIFRHYFRSRNAVLDTITLGDNLMFDV